MCGIAVVVPKPLFQGPDKMFAFGDSLHTMIESMEHRGPDGVGFYYDDEIGLAMTRLAIVGGNSGMQPIWNEDHTIALVCNGEIYNHQELRKMLEEHGHVFSTQSDVEVIVHLYEMYEEQCVQSLEGIFAFAVWDSVRHRLLAARDHFGVKPLYYAETDTEILFASELRALLKCPQVDEDLDSRGFAAYHAFRYVPANETLVQGIKKMAPAQYVVIQNGVPEFFSYWSPQTVWTRERTGQQALGSAPLRTEALKTHLVNAVKAQATDDVKTGVLLSGGLDSTALLALYRQQLQNGPGPDAYTVSFTKPKDWVEESEYNEIEQAQAIANALGTRHIARRYTPQEVLTCLPDIIKALDEPIADPTAIPLWFACRLARREGVKVLYSGEGLDELFNGYEVYRQKYWLETLKMVPDPLRRLAQVVLTQFGLPGTGILQRSLSSPAQWYQGVGGIFSSSEWKRILREGALHRYGGSEALDYAEKVLAPVQDKNVLTQMTYFDILSWLPENTLVKSDKISMAHSVELRVPFLDKRVVEFSLSVADRDKIRGKTGKWIVREALAEVVPGEVLRRKKAGFPIPLTAWIFNEWKDFVLSSLLDPNAYTRDLYNTAEIERLMSATGAAKRRSARLVWTLLSLELWHRYVYRADRLETRVPRSAAHSQLALAQV
ncbi:asparagine synthase (glutamine-hydrolyzing) [Alicyclobacillus tolerans]|uniref:asparagine synthase (glutamine-hydrolyzing) n=1 Tax=Alicyclobacillus tolerans TaxID=90970 RepID=UPI001F02D165|nr:asparagine synthase (glutamine-hydrolyzing) [Alicyclobacillus tolerans]MCF8567658.1 asparagine synthase (glutamine-hydrolyzing) [Alicyclobacillus tolerans]